MERDVIHGMSCCICEEPATQTCNDCEQLFCSNICAISFHYKKVCGRKGKKEKKKKQREVSPSKRSKFAREANVETVKISIKDAEALTLEQLSEPQYQAFRVMLSMSIADPVVAMQLCTLSKFFYEFCQQTIFTFNFPLFMNVDADTGVESPVENIDIEFTGIAALAQFSKVVHTYKTQHRHFPWHFGKFLIITGEFELFEKLSQLHPQLKESMNSQWTEAKIRNGSLAVLQKYGKLEHDPNIHGNLGIVWLTMAKSLEQLFNRKIGLYRAGRRNPEEDDPAETQMRRWLIFFRSLVMHNANDYSRLEIAGKNVPANIREAVATIPEKSGEKAMKEIWYNSTRWENSVQIRLLLNELWPQVVSEDFEEDPRKYYPAPAVNRWPLS